MDTKRATRISRFLSLVLRHEPQAAGVTLDAEGWAGVDTLLAGAAAAGVTFDRRELEHVVANNAKQRFALSDDGERIRASQGHSVDVDLKLDAVEPPAVLYHGTNEAALPTVLRDGLRPMTRRHVHLSRDRATAEKVGGRRGEPVVLSVDAAAMHAAGFAFHCSANGVWLTDAVPPRFLSA